MRHVRSIMSVVLVCSFLLQYPLNAFNRSIFLPTFGFVLGAVCGIEFYKNNRTWREKFQENLPMHPAAAYTLHALMGGLLFGTVGFLEQRDLDEFSRKKEKEEEEVELTRQKNEATLQKLADELARYRAKMACYG